MTNNDFYWYWFTNIAGIGVKTQKKLLEHFGHPSTIYNAPESEKVEKHGYIDIKTEAKTGETVTLTVTPDEGYQ